MSIKFVFWLCACWLSGCCLGENVDIGCYGNEISGPCFNPDFKYNQSTTTTTTTTGAYVIPERFNFVSRLQARRNVSGEENSTLIGSVEFQNVARDLVENTTVELNQTVALDLVEYNSIDCLNSTEIPNIMRDVPVVENVTGEYQNLTVAFDLDVKNSTEYVNSTEDSRLVRETQVEAENSTSNANYTEVPYVARDEPQVENSTEHGNSTEIPVYRQVRSIEVENSTNYVNSTEVPNVLYDETQVENITGQVENVTLARFVRQVQYEDHNSTTNSTDVPKVVREVQIEHENSSEYFNLTKNSFVLNDEPQVENSTFQFENITLARLVRQVPDSINTTSNETSARILANDCRGIGSCVNGICDKYSDIFNCICSPNYEGVTCESPIKNDLVFEKILNNTFCLDTFVNETFSNKTAAYDELLLNLVDKLWAEINPEEHYMHIFNYNNLTSYASVGQEVQKLEFYSRISFFNFGYRLNLYEQVIDKLIEYFDNSTMKEQAVNFVNEWDKSMKLNGRHVVNPKVVETVTNALNSTYYLASQLADDYERQVKNGGEYKVGNVDGLVKSSDQSWVKVVEYGFWHITGRLTDRNESQFLQGQGSLKRSLPQA